MTHFKPAPTGGEPGESGSVHDQLQERLADAIIGELQATGASAGLPPLQWKLSFDFAPLMEGTHPDGQSLPEAEALCAQWAKTLALEESQHNLGDGVRSWGASIGDWTVSVALITDQQRYKRNYGDVPLLNT